LTPKISGNCCIFSVLGGKYVTSNHVASYPVTEKRFVFHTCNGNTLECRLLKVASWGKLPSPATWQVSVKHPATTG